MPVELDPRYDQYSDLRREVHEFAETTVRPAAGEIDQLPYGEYVDITERGSLFWEVMGGIKSRGYHRALVPEEFGGDDFTAEQAHTLLEELAWGSSGFAMALGVHCIPVIFAAMTLDPDVQETFVDPWLTDEDNAFQGSWAITEPTHGSATLEVSHLAGDDPAGGAPGPETVSRERGEEWVIDGTKSKWVSAGPCATHTALQFDIDPGEPSVGHGALVDLRREGVTRGDPIRKLGQRACPQGSIAFDDVRVPERNVVFSNARMLEPNEGLGSMSQLLCVTSAFMATVSAGLARAAFEEALAHARERDQRGQAIGQYQSVQRELYDMFERVQTARSYSRQVLEHVWQHFMEEYTFDASVPHALAAQVYCKGAAYEVAHRAVQLHGGTGIEQGTLVEKLFRDARVKLIEDGTTEVLGMEAAKALLEDYPI